MDSCHYHFQREENDYEGNQKYDLWHWTFNRRTVWNGILAVTCFGHRRISLAHLRHGAGIEGGKIKVEK